MYAFIKIHLPVLLTLLISLLPPLYNNTHQSITFQNRKSPAWTLQAPESTLSSPLAYQPLWELCPPPANRVLRRQAEGWHIPRWSLGSLPWVLLSCREVMMGISVAVHVNVHVWEAVRNVSWRMEGCLSVTLPAHDKSLYLKAIHNSSKWTIGNVMENRAGVNDRRAAGNGSWKNG